MRFLLAATCFLAMTSAAFAQSCVTSGNSTYCNNGVSAQRFGNSTYWSDGLSSRPSQRSGTSTYFSNGMTSKQFGKTTYYSNGRTCTRVGNSSHCN
jgi:hypothetical protein